MPSIFTPTPAETERKEPGFGGKICVQVLVIVQVVLREVGEDRGGKDRAVHPL